MLRIACPTCNKQLQLRSEPEPGKRIKCPACAAIFDPLDADYPEENRTLESAAPPMLPPQRQSSAEMGSRPASRHPNSVNNFDRPKPNNKNWLLLIVSGIGALVVIAGGVSWLVSQRGATTNFTIEAPPTVSIGPPITDEEVEKFCEAMNDSISNRNLSQFQRLWGFNAMLDKSFAGIDISEKHKREFKRGAFQSIPQLANQIFEQAQAGSYQFVNSRIDENGLRQVTFRLVSDEGLNYHRFDLVRTTGRTVAAGDVYIAAMGERFSTTMRRLLFPMAASINRSFLDRLRGQESDLVKNLPLIRQIQTQANAGKYRAAMTQINRLPESIKNLKFVLILRTDIAYELTEKEYVESIETFLKHYPNETSLDLLLIDYYIAKGNIPESLKSIDQLNQTIGGDPYLTTLKAGLLNTNGQANEAEQEIQPLLNNPDYAEGAYGVLLDAALMQSDHAKTAQALTVLEQQYALEFGDLTQFLQYTEFVKSPEYTKWNQGRKGSLLGLLDSAIGSVGANGGGDDPKQAFESFQQAVDSSDMRQIRTNLAPLDGVEEFIAKLAVESRQPAQLDTYLNQQIPNISTRGDVAIGYPHRNTDDSSFTQVWFTQHNGRWYVCPTFDSAPPDEQYSSGVSQLQKRFEKRR